MGGSRYVHVCRTEGGVDDRPLDTSLLVNGFRWSSTVFLHKSTYKLKSAGGFSHSRISLAPPARSKDRAMSICRTRTMPKSPSPSPPPPHLPRMNNGDKALPRHSPAQKKNYARYLARDKTTRMRVCSCGLNRSPTPNASLFVDEPKVGFDRCFWATITRWRGAVVCTQRFCRISDGMGMFVGGPARL